MSGETASAYSSAAEHVGQEEEGMELWVPESWAQPGIGLYSPVSSGNRTSWRRLLGVAYCSGTYAPSSLKDELRHETRAWDAASDEAFITFERSLES